MNLFSSLVSWSNGAFMIGIFALVCVILVIAVLSLMFSGGKKKGVDTDNSEVKQEQ